MPTASKSATFPISSAKPVIQWYLDYPDLVYPDPRLQDSLEELVSRRVSRLTTELYDDEGLNSY